MKAYFYLVFKKRKNSTKVFCVFCAFLCFQKSVCLKKESVHNPNYYTTHIFHLPTTTVLKN